MVVLLIVVLACGAVAAGCGDDDGDSGGTAAANGQTSGSENGGSSGEGSPGGEVTTSSLNKAQFVKRANAICRKRQENLFDKIGAELPESTKNSEKTPSESELAEAASTAVSDILDEQAEAIQSLGAPEGEAEQVEAILAAAEEAAESLSGGATSDPDQLSEELMPHDEVVEEYGLRICAFRFGRGNL